MENADEWAFRAEIRQKQRTKEARIAREEK